MAATNGLPGFSMGRDSAVKQPVNAMLSAALFRRGKAARSAPAMNSSFAEVTMTPLTAASAMAAFTLSANAPTEASLMTFIGRPLMFQAMVAMPSASRSEEHTPELQP